MVVKQLNMTSISKFIKQESSSGLILILVTVIALVWVNSPLADWYHQLWSKTYLTFALGSFELSKPLYYWINDGLMAIFFFVIGLEIKREILVGELSSLRNALLPVIAALGGMVVPALLYISFNFSDPEMSNGWAIPMATDIAFSLGVLALLGSRVPLAIKVFLTALAIVDDIGAVLSIAIFYTDTINLTWLLVSAGVFILLVILNRLNVRSVPVYMVIGILGLWLPLLLSGVHATLAGIMLALTIPAKRKLDSKKFTSQIRELINHYITDRGTNKEEGMILSGEQLQTLDEMKETCERAESPLQRLEHQLKYPAIFIIMPIFALANTGIPVTGVPIFAAGGEGFFSQPVALGILAGLIFGKPLGIWLFTWLAVRLKVVSLPKEITMRRILGVGFLAGIGFTMSLFITDLAFEAEEVKELAKKAIFLASLISGVTGYLLLRKA